MKKLSISILSILFITASLFAGGPWTQKKGEGYFKLSEWWIVFDQHYTDQARIDPNVTTGIFNTYLYGEYGLSNRLTGVVNAALFSRNYMNNLVSRTSGETLIPGEALNSIGDIELGVKYSLTKPGAIIPVALDFRLGIPSGTTGGTQNNLQTGDGEFNQLIQLNVGKGFALKNNSAYISSYLGFNNRTNGFSEEWRAGLEAGLGLINQKLWLATKLDIIESFKNGDTAEELNSTSIFANNTEFTSITLEANYYINSKVGISASVATGIRGEVIAAANSYSVGIFLDL